MGDELFVIRDGVRRAKAAWLLGQPDIWAWVDGEPGERKISVNKLRTTKVAIDTGEKEGYRWYNVLDGMSTEPDLLEPIKLMPGDKGIPISEVELLKFEDRPTEGRDD